MARLGEDENFIIVLIALALGVSYMIFFAGSYYLLYNMNLIHASSTIKALIWFGLSALMLFIILLIYPLLIPKTPGKARG